MLKNALFFALAALVIGLSAPTFLPSGAALVAGPTPLPNAAPAPQPLPVEADRADDGFREASITGDAHGQYHANVLIEGQPVEMMVDTGATVVAISAATAAQLGVYPDPAAPRWRMTTANGVSTAAPVTLRRVSVGSIEMIDVQAVVMSAEAGNIELLGASFLKRLASVEQRDGVLVLKQ